MARDRKFRAWIGSKQQWADGVAVYHDGSWSARIGCVEGYSETDGGMLCQYTGLKDKNGVEIYEGDLFRCIYHDDGHDDHIYQVVYCESATGFKLKRMGNACPQTQVVQKVSDVARHEVIGNIYENGELLRKQV